MLLKLTILLIMIMAILYAVYVYTICQNLCFLPGICSWCPHKTYYSDKHKLVNIPPINTVAQQTARVLTVLTDTDVTAPRRMVGIQTILAEIDARLQLIDIDEAVRNDLKTCFDELDKLIENGIEQFIEMHTTMGSALDFIGIYTDHTLQDFIRIINGEKSHFGSERIGEPQNEAEKMNALFDDYITTMHKELEKILLEIKTVKTTLVEIKKKLKIIQNLYAAGKKIAEHNVEELKYGNIWRRIFGGNIVNIEREQRAINALEDFAYFNQLFLNNVGNVVLEIEEYKRKTNQLKETKIPSGSQPFKLNIYLEQMRTIINQFSKSKEEFNRKMELSKENRKKIDL